MKTINISPSDLTFLWPKSKRCFYLKYARSLSRPKTSFPQMFNTIDALMKKEFMGHNLQDMSPSLPNAKVLDIGEWVESVPVEIPELDLQIVIRGKIDTAIELVETPTYGITDFKTATPKHVEDYKLAMNAYAFAAENSAGKEKYGNKDVSLSPISTLGLIVWEPKLFTASSEPWTLQGDATWIEIEKNTDAFVKFLKKRVAPLLAQVEEPAPEENDEWYNYVASFFPTD